MEKIVKFKLKNGGKTTSTSCMYYDIRRLEELWVTYLGMLIFWTAVQCHAGIPATLTLMFVSIIASVANFPRLVHDHRYYYN
jgi:hypothetical protein